MTGEKHGGSAMTKDHLAAASTTTRRRLLKSVLALGGLATASPLLTAWPSPAAAAQTSAPTAAPAVNGTVTVVFWQHEDPRLTAATKEKIAAYKRVAPNVEIDFNSTPHVDYEPAIIAALAGGAGPDAYDIGDWNVPAFISKGIIDPLPPDVVGLRDTQAAIDEYISPNVLAGLTVNNQLYGFPLELSNFILYISDDQFREVGLDPANDYPKYWNDDFITVGKQLVKKDGDKWVREAYNLPYFDPTWNMLVTWPFFQQLGVDVVNQNGTASALDQSQALQAFKNMTDLITGQQLGDGHVGVASPTQPAQDFSDGLVSMWQLGPWGRSMVAGTNLEGSYRVVPLPQTKGGAKEAVSLYSWFWTVNPKTKNRAEAWKFVHFLAQDPEFWLIKLGVLQPRKNLLDTQSAKDFKFLDVILADQKKGVYMPRTEKFQQVQQAMWKATQRTCQEGMDAAQSLEIAHNEINTAMTTG
jgi:multiple sugar transport system substrate-binding protein